ncbi:MAG: TonB-dependent receptor [Acidobacteriota bacterium]
MHSVREVSLCLFLSALAFGQTSTGTVVGAVRDATGAVVVGAKVTVANQNTGVASEWQSDSLGNYLVPYLPPGPYRITVEYQGFRTAVSADIPVQVNHTSRVDFSLTPGPVTESITVEATAPLVRSTTSEIGHVIEGRQIQALPLNGRLFQQLILLTPGAVQRGFADFGENPAAAGARSPIHASVNGLKWSGNNFMIDGVANNEPLNAFINVTPPLEAIGEFKVQTNNPTAEFGVFGGAVVNLTLRSGTNELHGSLFEYLRNNKLNSRDFFAAQRAPFKTNQFGGTIGGPIRRNKAFFFGDYQGLRQRQGRTFLIPVPTPLMRQGVLTEGASPPEIWDPQGRAPFANRTIPASRLNPITRQAANVWPLPNLPGTGANYLENTSLQGRTDSFDVKVDWHFSPRLHFFARESFSGREITDPPPGNVFMNNALGINADSRNQNAVAGLIHTLAPNKINEVRVGFNRYLVEHFGSDFGIAKNNELGIPNGNVAGHPYTFGIARFDIPGIHPTGSLGSTNAVRIANAFQYSDNFTWVVGRHAMKFGADIRRYQSTLTNPQTQPRGQFVFDRNISSNRGAAATGSPWASFLLGNPAAVNRDFVDTRPGVRMTYFGLYFQNDLRVSPELTVNLGLRWDLYTRPVEKYNRQSNFSLTDGLIHLANADNRGPNVDNFMRSWGPRAGLAYSPDGGRTAFRAAYGISYFPDNFGATGGTLERNYPFFRLINLTTPDIFTVWRSVSDGLPGFTPVQLEARLTPPPGFAVFVIPRDFRQVMSQMWSFSIQRQLASQTMAEVAYVGTRGEHLFRNRNINVPLPGPGALPERRPYRALAPTITDIFHRSGDGDSYYNALQGKVERRFSQGMMALVSYTYSKSIDTVSNVIYPFFDKALNRGLSSGFQIADVPHNLVVSYRYELPFGPGRQYLAGANGAARKLVGGWSVNGITTIQSGQPLVVNVASSRLNTGTGNRADITCTSVDRAKTVERWFDTGCFADPAAYVFGNSGIGHARGPGLVNFDFSVFKDTAIDERRSIEFRAEFFNLFNSPHFANPVTTFGVSTFGRVTSTVLTPREVQLGLRFSF